MGCSTSFSENTRNGGWRSPPLLALGFYNTPCFVYSENRHCHHSSIDFLLPLVQVDMGPIVDQSQDKKKIIKNTGITVRARESGPVVSRSNKKTPKFSRSRVESRYDRWKLSEVHIPKVGPLKRQNVAQQTNRNSPGKLSCQADTSVLSGSLPVPLDLTLLGGGGCRAAGRRRVPSAAAAQRILLLFYF